MEWLTKKGKIISGKTHLQTIFTMFPKIYKLEKRTRRKRRLTKTSNSMDYNDNGHVKNILQLEQNKLGSNHLLNKTV